MAKYIVMKPMRQPELEAPPTQPFSLPCDAEILIPPFEVVVSSRTGSVREESRVWYVYRVKSQCIDVSQ